MKYNKIENKLKCDYNNMMAARLGARGITDAEIDALEPKLAAAADALVSNRNSMKWRELPYNQEAVVEQIEAVAADVRGRCENFVVLGIGGSALGPIAVHQALCHRVQGGPVHLQSQTQPFRLYRLARRKQYALYYQFYVIVFCIFFHFL